jgi:hypothetical protein
MRALLLAAMLAVGAVCIWGCGGDDGNNNPGGNGGEGGNGLLGDWLGRVQVESRNGYENVERLPDNIKFYLVFKSSGELIFTHMRKIEDFWVEATVLANWRTSSQKIVVDLGVEKVEFLYNISGDTLTCTQTIRRSGEEYLVTVQNEFHRDDLTKFKRSAGKIHRKDSALINTRWVLGREGLLEFWIGNFSSYSNGYIYTNEWDNGSNEYYYKSNEWYAEGSKLFLLGLGCDDYEYNNDREQDECVSYFVIETVELEYRLSNGNLRLRPVNSDVWDVWTPYVYDYDSMNKRQSNISERSGHPQSALFGLIR